MHHEQEPTTLVALYARLADVEATHTALREAGVAEGRVRFASHSGAELREANLPLGSAEYAWSLTVLPGEGDLAVLLEVLRRHEPLLLGSVNDEHLARTEVDQGQIAWAHYVFESPAASDAVTEAAGTTGTTGVVNSGAFAEGAVRGDGAPAQRDLSRAASGEE
jgi:hypothetical protein